MSGLLPLGSGLVALLALCVSAFLYIRSRKAERRQRETATALSAAELQVASLQAQFDSQSQLLRDAARQRDLLSGILDHYPKPVWARAPDLTLTYCNLAYAEAIGLPREDVLAEDEPLVEQLDRVAAHELALKAQESGTAQSALSCRSRGRKRRLMEITEQPLVNGSLVSFARDLTDLEQAQRDLDRRKEMEMSILERVGLIAVLDQKLRLSFFNQAYARIWGFDEDFLNSRPHVSEMLNWLRDRRLLPEQADYATFRRQRLNKLETLLRPRKATTCQTDGACGPPCTPTPSAG